MAIFDTTTKKFLCECGCGEECPPWNSYKHNHFFRSEEGRRVNSAAHLGLVHDEDTRKKVSEAGRRFWRSEEGEKTRDRIAKEVLPFSKEHKQKISESCRLTFEKDPSIAEGISKKLTGLIRTPEECRRNSEGQIRAYEKDPTLRLRQSEIKKEAWKDPAYAKRILGVRHAKPNKVEGFLLDWLNERYPGEWKYVGNGEVVIGGRNPDFINVNGRKAVIEVFGSYWHSEDNAEETKIEHYKKYGFECLVLWADNSEDIILDWPYVLEFCGVE